MSVDLSEFNSKRKTSWKLVAKLWEKREVGTWDEHIKKNGFKNWTHFRFGTQPLTVGEIDWYTCKVKDIKVTAPKILCGPFKGWSQYNPKRESDGTGKRESYPFAVLAESPLLASNTRIQSIQKLASKKGISRCIALYSKGDLVLIDGHHSLSALCLNLKQGKKINSELIIHVGMIPPEMETYFEKYKRGEVPSRLF